MEDRIFELIKPWAGVPTWHTSHPADRRRFFKVIISIIEELGSQIDIDSFERALRKHVEKNPAVLSNSNHWDNVIAEFVIKAELLIDYEAEKEALM
ncbi:hypothetical protein ACEWA7_20275 [Vibrio parahaemolyticus]